MKCACGRAQIIYRNVFLWGLPLASCASSRRSDVLKAGAKVRTRNHTPCRGFPSPSYGCHCEHGAVSTLPASTRNARMFAVDAVDGSLDVVADGEAELDSSTVPVNYTLLPTCGPSAGGFAIKQYV